MLFIDFMEISALNGDAAPAPSPVAVSTMSPTSTEPAIPEAVGTPGICTFVDTVSGTEKEEGQDRLSVQVERLCRRLPQCLRWLSPPALTIA